MPASRLDDPPLTAPPGRPLDHDVGRWPAYWAETRPTALAWADDHRRCDFRLAADRIERLAGWFDAAGVGPGDRIGLWLGNRGAVLEAIFAAARIGAIAIPINARLTPEEVAFQLDDSTPTVLLAERAWRDAVDQTFDRMTHRPPFRLEVGVGPDQDHDQDGDKDQRVDDAYERALAESSAYAATRSADPEAPLILMYTSGTTGRPKGALLPLRKTLYNGLNAERYFEIVPEDRVLVVAPLFHSLGLQILSLPAILCGAGLVIQEGFEPERVWRAVEREGITYFGGVPTMHRRLLDALDQPGRTSRAPASLRFVFTAGAAAPVELIRAFHGAGLHLKQGYGQTETSTLTCLDAAHALDKAGSVGRPVHYAKIRLIEPTSLDGPVAGWRDVGPGQVGEVVVNGPICMLGYWRRPEATAETLRDGWLRTGDLATRDADFDLTLVGRAREMYISGGENVYPAEVEAVLLEHPAIAEAAVVALPDDQWGEVGRAHVVAAAGQTIEPREVLEWLSTRLARFKQPRSVALERELPRTASGKVQKHRLTARAD